MHRTSALFLLLTLALPLTLEASHRPHPPKPPRPIVPRSQHFKPAGA